MIVFIGDYHESHEVREALRGQANADPLRLLREFRPRAMEASDRFRKYWFKRDSLPEVPGELMLGVKFLYDRQYDLSLFKRTAKTRTGYNADILLFRHDLSDGEIERECDDIYVRLEAQLQDIVEYIKNKNIK